MSGQVAEYRGLVESLAQKFVGSPRAIRAGVDYDDLVQEGLIDVWRAIEAGVAPSADNIANRMRDWIKLQLRQLQGDPVPYEDLLPLDGLRVVQPQE